ncbi:hypothetical protein KIN20_036766 [Parelaphostrongylus tenuis]|uniref:Uncharacterized protein n=1 Tax=Parelaphostrongylus tenuis TaxID=148309 RepID=A0AAD5RDK3_PARTN|nr:hypothetical protein KIN20_036766 [Parelaphostrongylus tenuis]
MASESKYRIGIWIRSKKRKWKPPCWIPVCGTYLPRKFTFPEERTPSLDMSVTKRYDACGKRPYPYQQKTMPAQHNRGAIILYWVRSPPSSSKDTI